MTYQRRPVGSRHRTSTWTLYPRPSSNHHEVEMDGHASQRHDRTRVIAALSDVGGPVQSACSAASIVCWSSIAMVIGPTPPGTGVIRLALMLAPAKSTSPMLPSL